MRGKTFTLTAILALGAATSAAAQRAPSLEVGGFASWTKFDESLQFKDRVGGGACWGSSSPRTWPWRVMPPTLRPTSVVSGGFLRLPWKTSRPQCGAVLPQSLGDWRHVS
jgi:hypothetical protein